MELFGKYNMSVNRIRSLAIQCHALDLSAYHLLVDSTHHDTDATSKVLYTELLTEQLLTLAIAIRTKFYQGTPHDDTAGYVQHCGLFYRYKGGAEEPALFTIKDICDKIIHADSVSKFLENGIEKATITLRGKQRDVEWELGFSVNLFCEGVLNWLQGIHED
ncbi:MAG: hypothetical protein ACP5SH_26820 [Syntrophobacteraceae bacterium]